MKRFCLMTVLGLLTCVTACTSVTEIENYAGGIKQEKVVIKATHEMDPQTKTVLQENGDVWWKPGDAIGVFFGPFLYDFSAYNMVDASSAYFVGESLVLQGNTENSDGDAHAPSYWGVFPPDLINLDTWDKNYDDLVYENRNRGYKEPTREGESVNVFLPASQIGTAGTFNANTFISVARSDDYKELSFYNLCGGVAFCVDKEGVHTVTFKGNAGETLAGGVNVVMSPEGYPVVNEIRDGKTEVELYMDSWRGRKYFVPGEWYYIVMLPTVLETGYTMEFHTDDEVGTLVYSSPVEIKRSVFGKLTQPDSDADWNDPEDEAPVAIELAAEIVSSGGTKSLGPVSGFSDSHELFVYGFGEDGTVRMNNVMIAAGDGMLTPTSGEIGFYDVGQVYSFCGYYVDDAAAGTPDEDCNLSVVIDGTQDIMLGKAHPEKDIIGTELFSTEKVYSSYSARLGVVPTLEFKHMLSKFEFEIKNQGSKDIELRGIALETIADGMLNVMAQTLCAGDTRMDMEFEIEAPIVLPTNQSSFVQVPYSSESSSIMVFPDVEHRLRLNLAQGDTLRTMYVRLTALLDDPGIAYLAQINVYSLGECSVSVSLGKWNPDDVPITK